MALKYFRFNDGSPVRRNITLVAGNTQILKLEGAKAGDGAAPYGVKTGDVSCDLNISCCIDATTSAKKPKQLEKTIILKVSPHCVSKSFFTLEATAPKGVPNALPVSSVKIEISPWLKLPSMDTDVGLLVRLLLAETLSPLDPDYGNGAAARESMDLMRQVLDNRVFAASTKLGRLINGVSGNATLRDIIFAPGQIKNFQGNTISGSALKTINGLMKIANDGTNRNFERVRAHVEYALKVAKRSPSYPSQITTSTLTHWRTGRSAPPSDNVVAAGKVANQQFWRLSEEFLKANKP
jgi:hypothetical protein